MKTKYFFVLIIITVIACNGKEKIADDKGIRLTDLVRHEEEKIYAHDVFKSIQIIKPETGNESLIGRFFNVDINSNYLLVNNEGKSLQVYDQNGKFIFKTEHGNGPTEVLNVSDFTVDTCLGEILVLDESKSQVMRYNFEGDFRGHFHIKERAVNMVYAGEKYYCFYVPFNNLKNTQNSYDLYFIADSTGEIFDSLKINRQIKSSPYVTQIPFITDHNRVYFQPLDYDTIYTISNFRFKPIYVLNYGKYKMPDSYYASTTQYQKGKRQFLVVNSILPTSDYLFITYQYHSPQRFAIYNKEKESFSIPELKLTQEKTGIIFGTDKNGIYLWPRTLIDDNHLLMTCSSLDIINYVNNYKSNGTLFYDQLIDSLEDIKENDNPLLFIGELR